VLFNCRVAVLFSKRRAGRLVFVCGGGPLGRVTLPESWTDRGPVPLVNRLSVDRLVELDTLLSVLASDDHGTSLVCVWNTRMWGWAS
jgi:hypothetical protein